MQAVYDLTPRFVKPADAAIKRTRSRGIRTSRMGISVIREEDLDKVCGTKVVTQKYTFAKGR